jgi:hypothetical protein
VAYNFQPGNNKVKLLAEFESVTQKVVLRIESVLENGKQHQRLQFYLVVSGLKIIGHGNPNNKLKLHCTFMLKREIRVYPFSVLQQRD